MCHGRRRGEPVLVMPEDKELGPSNTRINRWLEGVETAINEGTLYGRRKDKSVVWTGGRRNSVPFSIKQPLSIDDNHDNNQQVEWLDLESSRSFYFLPRHTPTNDKNTTLILPKIPRQASQKCPRTTENRLDVIDLEYCRIETEFMRKDTRMETIKSTDDDKSDCQVSIIEGVNQLSLNHHNNNDDKRFPDDKSAFFLKLRGSTGSGDNSMDQLTIIETTPKDLRHGTTSAILFMTCPALPCVRRGETRVSKDVESDLDFDPRFLMPTESSLEEARYLLASRRGSLPCVGRGMRRKSLDMVAEEQPTDPIKGENTMTSLVSQRVPRHRNRSRSLDNSFETRNSFAAFKESLKSRDVKRTRLGT
ncbi:hypothetical protein ACROYT_G042886 [Oculina patagonica]